jgi:hypothetical protein
MKTISNHTAIKLNNWSANDNFQIAMVHDMGLDPDLHTTDADCLYASARTMFLSSNTADYDRDNARYANPVMVDDGEIVTLERNGKQYKVHCTGYKGRFEYYTDILHFELVK